MTARRVVLLSLAAGLIPSLFAATVVLVASYNDAHDHTPQHRSTQ